MKGKNRITEHLNISPTGSVVVLKETSKTAGDPVRGNPSIVTTKEHVLKGASFIPKVKQEYIQTGIAEVGDVSLTSSEKIEMGDKVRHNEITYKIYKEVTVPTQIGTTYKYLMRRQS